MATNDSATITPADASSLLLRLTPAARDGAQGDIVAADGLQHQLQWVEDIVTEVRSRAVSPAPSSTGGGDTAAASANGAIAVDDEPSGIFVPTFDAQSRQSHSRESSFDLTAAAPTPTPPLPLCSGLKGEEHKGDAPVTRAAPKAPYSWDSFRPGNDGDAVAHHHREPPRVLLTTASADDEFLQQPGEGLEHRLKAVESDAAAAHVAAEYRQAMSGEHRGAALNGVRTPDGRYVWQLPAVARYSLAETVQRPSAALRRAGLASWAAPSRSTAVTGAHPQQSLNHHHRVNTLVVGQLPYFVDATGVGRLLAEFVAPFVAGGVARAIASLAAIRPHERAGNHNASSTAVSVRRCGLWFVEVTDAAVFEALQRMHKCVLLSDSAVFVAETQEAASAMLQWTEARDFHLQTLLDREPAMRQHAHSRFRKGLGAVTIERCTDRRQPGAGHQRRQTTTAPKHHGPRLVPSSVADHHGEFVHHNSYEQQQQQRDLAFRHAPATAVRVGLLRQQQQTVEPRSVPAWFGTAWQPSAAAPQQQHQSMVW